MGNTGDVEPAPDETLVVAPWWANAFVLAFGLLMFSGGVFLLLTGSGLRERASGVIGVGLGIAWVPPAVRQLVRPRPSLRVADDGIEGRWGYVPWSTVERIRDSAKWSVWPPHRDRRLELVLRPGAPAPEPTRRAFAGGMAQGRADVSDECVSVPYPDRRSKVLSAVAKHWHGTIE